MRLPTTLVLSLLLATPALAQSPPANQCITTAVAGGTGDAITIPTLPCVPTTTLLILTTKTANSTTAPTLQYPGGTLMTIQQFDGSALAAGQLKANAHYILTSNGLNWFVLQTQPSITAPLVVTDNKTGPITTIGSAITGASSNQASADLIESYVFCTSPNSASNCGGGNYDAVAGIAINNPGTTTNVVSGLTGYALANQAFSGSGPSSVALLGIGAINADNAEIWGMNVNMSDREYRVAQPVGTHGRRVTGTEIDVSASYPDTNITGLFIAGNSVVQPNNSTAIAVLGQDFSAPGGPGSIAKWTQAFYSYPGVATHFANIGEMTPSTVNSNSQDVLFNSYVASVPYLEELWFGLATPVNFGSTVQPTLNSNYGFQVATGGVTARSTTDQIVQLGGKNALTTGATVSSRTDAGALQPLEILSSNTLLNSSTLQVNGSGTIQTGVTCTGTPTSSFATVNGIVTHC